MRQLLLFFLLMLSLGSLRAQIGISQIGIIAIGGDSLRVPVIGNASTSKCTAPGSCINSCPVYIFRGAGAWSIEGNWKDGFMPPAMLTGCCQILIEPMGNNECVIDIPLQVISSGTSIIIMPGKRFRIPGKLINQ